MTAAIILAKLIIFIWDFGHILIFTMYEFHKSWKVWWRHYFWWRKNMNFS